MRRREERLRWTQETPVDRRATTSPVRVSGWGGDDGRIRSGGPRDNDEGAAGA